MDRHYFSVLVYSALILLPTLDRSVQAMPFTTESVQSGEWSDLARIDNRIDFSLDSPIISIHAFAADQHSSAHESLRTFGLSVDEQIIGTRIVCGPLKEVGLPARLMDPLAKTVPSGYGRLRPDFRLDTGASGSKPSALFTSFSPRLPNQLELSTGITYGPDESFTGVASFGVFHAIDRRVRFDVLATRSILPPRVADAWFSVPPPLPRREQELFAISTSAAIPILSAALDLAWSDQHFSGKGWHIGGTTNVRNSAFSTDISADYTSSRFTDTEGVSRGSGLRASFETRLKRPSSSITHGINAAIYDSPLLNDMVTLEFAYLPSEASSKKDRRFQPYSPFKLKAFTTEAVFTEVDVGTWTPSFKFRVNHVFGNTTLSEKAGFDIIPNTFGIESFTCGLDATIPFEKRRLAEFGMAELDASISMKKAITESLVFSCRIGVEWKVRSGGIHLSFGTNDSATAENLLTSFDRSKSAFGPWTINLGWRFEESRPPAVLIH